MNLLHAQARSQMPLSALVASCLLAACAHFPLNTPLTTYDPQGGYRLEAVEEGGASDDLLLVLAFSGGGTRAAALAYGVLEALRDTAVGPAGGRRLLDEVDLITAVSGGAFTAAYYALRGEGLFAEFEPRFLKQDIQRILFRRMASPRNWVRLASPNFDRTDLAAEWYDQHLFDRATFADLAGRRPFLLINATDISLGTRFEFTQPQFDQLCSDLSRYPIARAVAASSAVPVVLPPLTLRNYGWSHCGYREPSWLGAAAADVASPRRRHVAEAQRSYGGEDQHPWVHLLDGGLTGNLGLQALLDALFVPDPCHLVRTLGLGQLSRVAVVVVNATAGLDPSGALTKGGPGLAQIGWATAAIPIDRLASQTLEVLEDRLRHWAAEAGRCLDRAPGAGPIAVYPVVVGFDQAAAERRARLRRLPTAFHLEADEVDALRATAAEVLRGSEVFRRLLADLAE